jgi:hypothetical protein
MRLLTVSTISYLHQVDVLFSHAKRIHPELKPTVLIADCSPKALEPVRKALGPEIDVLCTADLEFDFLEGMRSYYSALEYCSALKVLGSAYILRNEDNCLFLDPDMVILESLTDAVINQPGEIVACCHSFSTYPNDGESPDDLELCLSGHLNGGVFMTRRGEQGNVALDWLVEKTKNRWFVAPELGMYADQQWLSALPYFFRDRTTVVSDPSVNVAYWNLHERPLRLNSLGMVITLANGNPLRLMHFSGFSLPSNGRISKHTNRRFDLDTEAILRAMIYEYESTLIDSRSRFKHLSGDLKFCNLPLQKRIRIASDIWKDPHLASSKTKFLSRIWCFLRSRFISKN